MGSDRYHSPNDYQLVVQIRELERRIKALESGAGLGNSSITKGGFAVRSGANLDVSDGGSIQVSDGGDVEVSGGGNIQATGGGQVRVFDDDGDIFFVDSDPAELFMREELFAELSAGVLGARVFADTVVDVENSTSPDTLTFTNLETTGPTVTSVPVSAVGKALIFFAADITLGSVNGATSVNREGYISFATSGATTRAASLNKAGRFRINFATHADTHIINASATAHKVILEEGLNEGLHTFQMKYSASTTGIDVNFGVRTIVAIGL